MTKRTLTEANSRLTETNRTLNETKTLIRLREH
jgi:hypothetical protein